MRSNCKIFIVGISLAGLLVSHAGCAATDILRLQNGNAVDPYCLYPAEEYKPTIDLAHCDTSDVVLKPCPATPRKAQQAKEFCRIMEFEYGLSGMINYSVIGTLKGRLVLLIQHNDGGTGQFSELITAYRKKDTLTDIKTIAAGDACTGAVYDAFIRKGHLYYSQSITPYDLLKLGNPSFDNLSVESNHHACFGGAKKYQDGNLTEIRINIEDSGIDDKNADQQACFDKLLTAKAKDGKVIMLPGDVQAFAEEFEARCMYKQIK